MTIKEAKKLLDQFPDDYELVLSSDSEGNGYSPACDVWQGFYCAENTWSGTMHGPDELEDLEDFKGAVVLCPVN